MLARARARKKEKNNMWERLVAVFSARSPRSQAVDARLRARIVCSPDDEECIKRWLAKRGIGIDVEGLDTPGSSSGTNRKGLLRALGEEVARIWRSRSTRSRLMDIRERSETVVSPTDPEGLKKWIRLRGVGIDIEGLDTPSVRVEERWKRKTKSRGPPLRLFYVADLDTLLWKLETTPMREGEHEDAKKLLIEAGNKLEHDMQTIISEVKKSADIDREIEEELKSLDGVAVRLSGYLGKDLFYAYRDSMKSIGSFVPSTKDWVISVDKLKRISLDELGKAIETLRSHMDELMDNIYVTHGGKEISLKELLQRLERIYFAKTRHSAKSKPLIIRTAYEDEIAKSIKFVKGRRPRPQSHDDYALYYALNIATLGTLASAHGLDPKSLITEIERKLTMTIRRFNPFTRRFEYVDIPLYYTAYTRGGEKLLLIPRGLMPVVEEVFEERGVPVISEPYAPWVVYGFKVDSPVKLRYYQGEAVASVLEYLAKYGATTLQAATGAGKTEMAIDAIIRVMKSFEKARKLCREKPDSPGCNAVNKMNGKIVFMTLSTDLLRQFKKRAERYGLKVGLVTADEFDVDKPIVAITAQSAFRALSKVEKIEKGLEEEDSEELEEVKMDEYDVRDPRKIVEILKNATMLVFDEAHHVPARTVKAIVMASPWSLKLGLSATPWRNDERDNEIYAYMGSIASRKITSSELIEQGYLVPAKIFMVEYSDYPLELYGRRVKYQTVLSKVYSDRKRNEFVAEIALRLKKLGMTPGLVLVTLKKHGELLEKIFREKGLKTVFVSGELPPKKREEIFDMARRGELDYIIATSLADEGLDLPPLRTLILASTSKSKTKTLQRVGRVIRPWPGKSFGLVVDVVDRVKYLEEHGEERRKLYNMEKLWDVTVLTGPKETLLEELEKRVRGLLEKTGAHTSEIKKTAKATA
jgi:superfamily II DNA or RNA helicase